MWCVVIDLGMPIIDRSMGLRSESDALHPEKREEKRERDSLSNAGCIVLFCLFICKLAHSHEDESHHYRK